MASNNIEEAIEKQPWTRIGSLYVPTYSIPKLIGKPRPISRGFAIYLPHSELFGNTLTEEEIISTIKEFKASDGVASASKIEITLENHGHFNKRIQIGVVVHIFPKEVAKKINEKLILEEDRFIFFEQQLLNVIKLSLLHGSLHRKRTFQQPEVFNKYLQKVVLGITDHLEKIYMEEEKETQGDRQKQIELMISMVVRNIYFNASEQFRYLISRYFLLYFVLPNRRHLRKSPNFVDFNKLCKKVTSFDLLMYYTLGIAILTQYVQANVNKGQLNPNNFLINKNVYFREIKIGRKIAVRFLNRLSLTAKSFREEFPKELEKTKNFYYSFILMRQKPIVRVNEYVYFPAGLRFLKEKLTSGIFWEIFDSLDDVNKNKLFRFFGELFEEYIKDIFKRIYYGKKSLGRICHFEKEYGRTRSRTSDIMLCYPPEAIFIEANVSRLRMVETAIVGDIDAFRKDLEKIIYNSAKQLSRVINDFQNKRFDLDGIGSDQIKKIYPVILTLSPIPQADLLWIEEIEKTLKKLGYLQQNFVSKLQLIDAEEMEMIEGLAKKGIGLLEILKGKLNDPEYVYKPMKNYLLARIFDKKPNDYSNEYLRSKFQYISKLARNKLFGVPLSARFPRRKIKNTI